MAVGHASVAVLLLRKNKLISGPAAFQAGQWGIEFPTGNIPLGGYADGGVTTDLPSRTARWRSSMRRSLSGVYIAVDGDAEEGEVAGI